MLEVKIILGLLVAVAAIVAVSRRTPIPYPVLLVLGGLILALVPGLPSIHLQPNLVFLLFLPPLLYWESLTAPLRDFRANARPIFSLAFGLVLATTAAVALVAHKLIPGLSWPAAFVLGAVIAPTDEVAVAEVATHLPIPDRVLAILEGESLINDAISLVAYRIAVAAVVTGAFSLAHASVQFLEVGLGGTAIGLMVGWGIVQLRRHLRDDPPVENTISLLTPFAAYLAADTLGTSGVLAVVAIGLYVSRYAPRIISSRTRLQALALWPMLAFLLNGLLFILTGLQLRLILSTRSLHFNAALVGYIAAILAVILIMRVVWIYASIYLRHTVLRLLRRRAPLPPWQQTFLLAWGGIRGGISLVTALAVPLTLAGGTPFPDRDLIICISFCIILATLLLQGIALPWVIPLLKLTEDGNEEREEKKARLAAIQAALTHLDTVTARGKPDKGDSPATDGAALSIQPELIEDLRSHYLSRKRHLTSRALGNDTGPADGAAAYKELRRELLLAERNTVIRLRDEEVINDDVLLRIQRDLDLEDARLAPMEED